jgi:tetratricopeptide (TPR) repeat protein
MRLSPDQQQALDRAIRHHRSGELREAEKIYRGLLNEHPDQADALHFLGVIRLQVGQFEEAISLIQQAVDVRPDYIDAIVNLGNGLQALGRFDAAAVQFERVLSLGSPTALVLANLGGALAELGRLPEAIMRFEAALKLQPELTETRRSLADALLKVGRANDALREITNAVSNSQPSIALQVSMGNILFEAGRIEDAIRCFNYILKAQPDLVPVRGNLARVLRKTGKTEAAIEQYDKVLKQDPKLVEGHYNLGLAYRDMGKQDLALTAFRHAVELDVNCGKAWLGISAVSKNAFNENEVNTLLNIQQDADTVPEQRMGLAFALGNHFENSDRHEEAAAQYLAGNALKRAIFDYDVENDLLAMNNLRARLDRAFLDRWQEAGLPDSAPIFVVGMPRSGTSLVEQILASHSKVFGAGELPLLSNTIIDTFPISEGVDYTGALDDASAVKFQLVAKKYLDGLPDVAANHITDKLPHNFLNLGMIRILFPNATIVHCRRDPRDTCFSIYKNLFGVYGHFFAYDLEELARYYNGYSALMNHWEDVMPSVIHTIDYEAMIDNQEQTTRELLQACGLEWEPACLGFHKTERPVLTISSLQVRQPVYRSSIGAWRPYEKMLQPLLEILDHG